MHLPGWVTQHEIGTQERKIAELRFRMGIAAIHHNEHGSLVKLSEAAGYHGAAVRNAVNLGCISLKLILAIEALVGSDVFDRDMIPCN